MTPLAEQGNTSGPHLASEDTVWGYGLPWGYFKVSRQFSCRARPDPHDNGSPPGGGRRGPAGRWAGMWRFFCASPLGIPLTAPPPFPSVPRLLSLDCAASCPLQLRLHTGARVGWGGSGPWPAAAPPKPNTSTCPAPCREHSGPPRTPVPPATP